MKVILIQDVKKQGKKGDIIDCTPGYANFLLTKNLAIEANPQNIAVLNEEKESAEQQKKEELSIAQKLKEVVEKIKVVINVKIGSNGKFFGAVSSKQIADALLSQHKIEIDKRKIILPNDKIDSLGMYSCLIKLHKDVTATLAFEIKESKEN